MMSLLISEILPFDAMPDRLAPWLDDMDEYVTIVSAAAEEEEHAEPYAAVAVKTLLTWSRLLSTRWGALANLT
jgi:hypothetical protein